MTRPAEPITIEHDGALWAPARADLFLDRTDDAWTPGRARRWLRDQSPPARGLMRKVLGPREAVDISTALRAGATRYGVRSGLLVPRWVAFSRVDEDVLRAASLPPGSELTLVEHAVLLTFSDAPPLPLESRLGLIRVRRCDDDLHAYLDRLREGRPDGYLEPWPRGLTRG